MAMFSARRIFENSLVLACVVPYTIQMLRYWSINHDTQWDNVTTLIMLVSLLNMVHVPATLYLYFDPAIRERTRQFPLSMAAMPLAAILITPLLIFQLLHDNSPASQYGLLILIAAFAVWQAWHF